MMPSPLQTGDPQRIGEFWLAGRLGVGGQGTVYEGYGPDGARVAVKVLHGLVTDSADLRALAREVQTAQRVASFCTARVVACDLEGTRPYIVSEFVDGVSLGQAVKDGRRFAGDDLYRLAIGIATALVAIHEAGVIHRDLKPGNVLLGPDGPRVIDFGVARTLEMSLTPTGAAAGTPLYMAPEIYSGQRATAAADVFAWAAILLFAATGEHAFAGPTLTAVMTRILTTDPDLRVLPEPLCPLAAAALAKDPQTRPSARTLLAALVGASAETPPTQNQPTQNQATQNQPVQDPPVQDQPGLDPSDLVATGTARARTLAGPRPPEPDLGQIAENAYLDLDPAARELVPDLLLRLLVPDGDDLRTRQLPLTEILGRPHHDRTRTRTRTRTQTAAPPEGTTQDVLDRVLSAFEPLLSSQDGHVVLTHPVLVRAWPRLRHWYQSHAAALPGHQQIRQAATTWHDHGHHGSDLLTGRRLQDALLWATQHRHPALTDVERAFLHASTRHQARTTRRRRLVAGALAVLVAVALTATGLVVRARQDAAAQRDLTISQRLVTHSQAVPDDPQTAALLAAAAWRFHPTPEARAQLLDLLYQPTRTVLTGHTGPVPSMAFSPDGHTLASAGGDGTVRLWDLTTHRQRGAALTGHVRDVRSVAFSPDGRTLASAGGDGTVRLWDLATHRQQGTALTSRTGGISTVAFSPDGHTLATGGNDKTIRLWDVATHHQLGTPLTGHALAVTSVAFAPDGRTVASGSLDGTVRVWDVATHRHVGAVMKDHAAPVTSVAFSPDGRTLASGGADRTARLWEVRTHRQFGDPLTGHRADVASVAFTPDGQTLVTGSADRTVQRWDVTSGRRVGDPLPGGNTLGVASVAVGPDSHTIAAGGYDGVVRVWDVAVREPVGTAMGVRTLDVESVAFSPDGRTLVSAGMDKAVRLWDTVTHGQIGEALTGHTGTVYTVAFSPDGHTVASGSADGTVRLWDTVTHRQVGAPLVGHGRRVRSVAFSPDGRTLAAGGEGAVRLWDVATRRLSATVSAAHDDATAWTSAVAFSPDGRVLATGDGDGMVRLWDTTTHRLVDAAVASRSGGVPSVVFSRDGRTLAAGTDDKTVWLWDTAAHRQSATLVTGHDYAVLAVAFSPDGRTLATGSRDTTARLWDTATRHQIGGPVTGHVFGVNAVAFSPDGRALATASGDGKVRLWDVTPPPDLAGAACALAGRTLTREEWDRYVSPRRPYRAICPR